MKRKILICTLFLYSFTLAAAEINITADRTGVSKSYVATIASEYTKMLVSLSQTNDGLILKAPPFICSSFDNWYIGEIKDSGLMKQIIKPTEKSFDIRAERPFLHVSTPALVPEYAGVAKSLKMVDFAVLSPVFSPSSPLGAYFDAHYEGLYVGTLYLNYPQKEVSEFLPSWQDVFKSGISEFGIIGYSDQFSLNKIDFKLSVFNQTVFREMYGLSGMLGWNVDVVYKEQSLGLFRRISSNNTDTPKNLFGFVFNSDCLSLGYQKQIFQNSSFGGVGQKQKVEYSTTFSDDIINLSIIHAVQGQSKTDKESWTSYEFEFKGKEIDLGLFFEINRSYGLPIQIKKSDFYIKAGLSKFCIENAKYMLWIALNEDMIIKDKVANINFSVNQDREYTISFKLSL